MPIIRPTSGAIFASHTAEVQDMTDMTDFVWGSRGPENGGGLECPFIPLKIKEIYLI